MSRQTIILTLVKFLGVCVPYSVRNASIRKFWGRFSHFWNRAVWMWATSGQQSEWFIANGGICININEWYDNMIKFSYGCGSTYLFVLCAFFIKKKKIIIIEKEWYKKTRSHLLLVRFLTTKKKKPTATEHIFRRSSENLTKTECFRKSC